LRPENALNTIKSVDEATTTIKKAKALILFITVWLLFEKK
jgi:hypothetical protein